MEASRARCRDPTARRSGRESIGGANAVNLPDGTVESVSRSASHTFSKPVQESIRLLAGLGVEGDAHAGVTVQHRSRIAKNPGAPNLRQVHLLHAELFDELMGSGFAVFPGDLGENITTRGVDLLALPTGTRLGLG